MFGLALASTLLHPVFWFITVLAFVLVSLSGFSVFILPAFSLAVLPLLSLFFVTSWLTALSEIYSGISASIMLITLTAGLYLCLNSDTYLDTLLLASASKSSFDYHSILLALSHSFYIAAGVVVLMMVTTIVLEFSWRFVFGDSICGLKTSFESIRSVFIGILFLYSFSSLLEFFGYVAK